MAPSPRPPLAVTMGEPAGIGPDLILQLYADRQALCLPVFAVYGNLDFLRRRALRLGLSLALADAADADADAMFPDALPVVDIPGPVADTPGVAVAGSAPVVIEAIARAVGDVMIGRGRALVTGPIHKAALYGVGFAHPGHTEYLAHLCAGGGTPPLPVMMLAHDDLRVVPLTIHIPLAQVPERINTNLIVRTARVVARDLCQRLGIGRPRIGITGLNPHAGEDGTIGREEIEQIAPAVTLLTREGIDATGPLSADTVFFPPHWRAYDVIIAMYHDQALIPIKTVAFDEGVNVTLGLPIVRTSPDHGTAFALAGTGKASARSMLAAIRMADRMSASR